MNSQMKTRTKILFSLVTSLALAAALLATGGQSRAATATGSGGSCPGGSEKICYEIPAQCVAPSWGTMKDCVYAPAKTVCFCLGAF